MADKYRTYRAQWSDWNGSAMVLDIIDTETVSDGVTTLEVGSAPMKTKRDDDESPLAPLRSGSGTIKLVGTYKTLEFFTISSAHRYRVRVTKDGSVVWLGWLKGESLSQDYASASSEFSVNVIDDIEVLDSWKLTQKTFTQGGREYEGDFGFFAMTKVLAEIFCRVDSVYTDESGVADELKFLFPVEAGTDLWQLKATVCRSVFFESKDTDDDDEEQEEKNRFYEADSLKEALEEICNSFGWSCQAEGLRIVFSSARGSGEYVEMTFSELFEGTIPTATTSIGAVSLSSYGEHDFDQYAGVHKVNVKAEISNETDLVPNLDDLVEFTGWSGIRNPEDYTLKALVYKPKDSRLKMYELQTQLKSGITEPTTVQDFDTKNVTWNPMDWTLTNNQEEYVGQFEAGIAKVDSYLPDEEKDKKNYSYKYAFLFNLEYPYWWLRKGALIYTPLVEFRGPYVSFSGGAIVLSCNIFGWSKKAHRDNFFIKDLSASIVIGRWCWNTELYTSGAWAKMPNPNRPQVVYFALNDTGESLKDTKTLDMPYNGASGTILPITTPICGEVRIILTAQFPSYTDPEREVRFGISDLSVKYYPTETNEAENPPDHYNYTKYYEGWADESESRTVKLHSSHYSQPGFGQLYLDEAVIEQVNGKRPEEWLLGKMTGFFGRSRRMIKVEAKTDMTIKPGDVYTDADGGKWSVLGDVETDWLKGKSVYYLVDLTDEQ